MTLGLVGGDNINSVPVMSLLEKDSLRSSSPTFPMRNLNSRT